MDGHDNDEHANNASSTQGGIFSTPDLTVNDGNIAQPVSNPDGERKRVASIFANTDTGRQAQRLNDAMEAQTTPITEDLVINNGPRAKSKLPIILLAIVLVGAVIGFVVWMVMGGISEKTGTIETQKTPHEALSDYLELAEKGPSDHRNDGDSNVWFIFQASLLMSTDELRTYANDLTVDYEIFEKSLSKTKQEDLSYYKDLSSLFVKNASLAVLVQDTLYNYIDKGADTAFQYIAAETTSSSSVDEDDLIVIAYDAMKEYLVTELNLIEMYSGWGCVSERMIDYGCTLEHGEGSNAYETASKQRNQWLSYLGDYVDVLKPTYMELTNTLSDELEK